MTEKKPGVMILPRVEEPPAKTLPERQFGGPQSGLPPPYVVGSELAPYLILGMDFGSNYCRVSTFTDGAAHALQPYEYRALVEDVLALPVEKNALVHSLKYCVSYGYAVKYGDYVTSSTDLVATYLRNIKERIERNTRRLLAKAVISVPAFFTHCQRTSLIQAAKDAEIQVLGLINEPTAAALDISFTRHMRNGKCLVISSGTYTFEASIVDIQNGLLEVKAVRGDRKLSGHEVTCRLTEGIRSEFNIEGNADLLHALCDAAKPSLDKGTNAAIDLGDQFINFDRTMGGVYLKGYRAELELLLCSLLDDTCTRRTDISKIILTGESTRCWLMREILQEMFPAPSKMGLSAANVSAGAAIYAALLVRQAKDWVVWDCLADPTIVAQGVHVKGAVAKDSPVPISGHAELTPDSEGKITAKILQTRLDTNEDVVPVAMVSIVEELPQGESAAVDLTVTATTDGTLAFTARHKSLDVNLTLTVEEAHTEEQIIDLSPPRPIETKNERETATPNLTSTDQPAEELKPFHPGISVRRYGDRWIVDAVAEGSSADQHGISVYDELLWIDKRHVFHLNKNVTAALHGRYLDNVHLTLMHASNVYSVKVARDVYRQAVLETLKEEVADATIEGGSRKVVDALLCYAELLKNMLPDTASLDHPDSSIFSPNAEQNYNRAKKAMERALDIATSNLKANDILRLRSLCCVCSLELRAPGQRISKIVVNVRLRLVMIARFLSTITNLPPSAAKYVFDLARELQELDAYLDAVLNSRTLLRAALNIAGHHCINPLVWKDVVIASSRTPLIRKPHPPQVPHSPDFPEAKWAADYADAMLTQLLKPLETAELKHALQQIDEQLAEICLPADDALTSLAFMQALSYKLHGDWLLELETSKGSFDDTARTVASERCCQENIIPCESSAQAYEFARCIFLRLSAIYWERPARASFCQSMLAVIYAGMGNCNQVKVATDRVHKLVAAGARYQHTTILDACDIFIKSKRFDMLEHYCLDQAALLKSEHVGYKQEQRGHAIYSLAWMYSVTGDLKNAQTMYLRLLDMFQDDPNLLYELHVKYTEFLFRTDDHFAEQFLVKTEALGRQIKVLTDETVEKWANDLRSKKGNRKFE